MQESHQEEKLNSIRNGILAAVEDLCSCTVPENSIHDAVFSCRNSNRAVVFKAQISIENEVMSADQMLKIISSWAKTSPSIMVLRSLLQVDPTCPAELETILADDCQKPIHPNNYQHSTTHSISEVEHGDNAAEILTIVGTLVGVLVAATVIATIVIGCVVFHRAKRAKNQGLW